MDGIFSMAWDIFGLLLSLILFLGVGILALKYVVIFGIKTADEVQRVWDETYPMVRRGRPKGSKNHNNVENNFIVFYYWLFGGNSLDILRDMER
jgi:hypothetical protein